jgi:tetratricopeptide (TPR) repeat protein
MRRPHNSFLAFLVALLTLFPAVVQGPQAQEAKPDALNLYRSGKYEEARVACLGEIASDPSNIESYVVLGWSLVALERYADAEVYARKAYDQVRKDPRIMETLGESDYFLGKNTDSLRWFQAYVTAVPEGSRVASCYYYMGEIYIRSSRWGHADIAFRTALQYVPNNARWWARLGYAREQAGELRYALEAYNEALTINPGLSDAALGKDRVTKRIH